MDEKTAKKLIAAIEANTKAQEEANKLTRLVLGKAGQKPPPADPRTNEPFVDPLTAHLKNAGKE